MSTKVTAIKKKRQKSQRTSSVDLDRIASGVRLILEGIGEDPNREGLLDTRKRVAEVYAELPARRHEDAAERIVPLSGNKQDYIVIVTDISIDSLWEHHHAAFVGR